jgi:hypothetical protein
MNPSRQPGTLPAVAGRRAFHTIYCESGREALIRLYAGESGTIVKIRSPVQYAGTPGAWVLDLDGDRLPDHYWVLLHEWDGPALPKMECAHGIRDVDWQKAASGQMNTV